MKLPGGDKAIVEAEKLIDYCLSPHHLRGKHKARVFATTLGFTAGNAELLRQALLAAAAIGDAQHTVSDKFGDRYVLDFEAEGPEGKGVIRSAWILRHGESRPRFDQLLCEVKLWARDTSLAYSM